MSRTTNRELFPHALVEKPTELNDVARARRRILIGEAGDGAEREQALREWALGSHTSPGKHVSHDVDNRTEI